MSVTYNLTQDLKEAAAMADTLEDYVRGTELYGHAGGGFFANLPSLTVGALAMRLRRLELLRTELTSGDAATLDAAIAKYRAVEKEWNVHFTEKITKEVHSRLEAMKPFFQECTQDRKSCAGNYPPEAARRTIIEELLPVLAQNHVETADLATRLIANDAKLRGIVRPAGFSWAPVLQPLYPADQYWWLYQRPPQD